MEKVNNHLKITDVTSGDGHQSVLATRIRTAETVIERLMEERND